MVGQSKRAGLFITFEGPEGGGKTSQLAELADFLRHEGYPILTTREPGGTPIGEQIRDILHNLANTTMVPRAEALLYQASRAQLVEEVVLPHLNSGGIVLCDRYADSTLAYQGYGHQRFSLEELKSVITFATGGLTPDLTLLLDIDVELGLKRKMQGGEWNRLDAYDRSFHERVRAGFIQMAKAEPERWVVINAEGPPNLVQREIRRRVMMWLDERG